MTDLDERRIRSALAPVAAEPVAWQRRLLPHEKVTNTDWHNIDKSQYDFAINSGGGVYGIPEIKCEVRPLYASPVPAAVERGTLQRTFVNEHGNAIKITIEGPSSVSENVLTLIEAAHLRDALNEALPVGNAAE